MDASRLNASLDQAERLLNQGSLHDAEAIYREVLDEVPGQPIASQGLGLIALHTGHASAAVELLQMAAIGQPDDAAIHTHLGLAFGAAGDQASSEACLRKAIDLAPSFADAHLNLANLLLETRRINDAAQSYERAKELAPESGPVYYGTAMLEMRRGDHSAAIEALETALHFAPALLPARVNLANLLLHTGKHAEAVAHLEEAVAIAPNNFDAQLNCVRPFNKPTGHPKPWSRDRFVTCAGEPRTPSKFELRGTADGHPEEAWRTRSGTRRRTGLCASETQSRYGPPTSKRYARGLEDFEARPSRGAIPRLEIAASRNGKDRPRRGKQLSFGPSKVLAM